jgi:dCMP deaminase
MASYQRLEDTKKVEHITEVVSKWKDRINWDDYFASISILASARSSCTRLNVGCVLVKDRRVVAMGYNGFIAGAPHTSIVKNNHERATVHAEINAIADCAKRSASCDRATAYVSHHPCINCAKALAAAGIVRVVYVNDYKNDDIAKKLLKEANIEIMKL